MLLNIIDGSDRTDHFDRIISIQVIEICWLIIYLPGLREVARQLRFFVSQRKTNGLESIAKRVEKVQDLAKRAEKPDKSGASYKAWEDFGYHSNRSLRKQM